MHNARRVMRSRIQVEQVTNPEARRGTGQQTALGVSPVEGRSVPATESSALESEFEFGFPGHHQFGNQGELLARVSFCKGHYWRSVLTQR